MERLIHLYRKLTNLAGTDMEVQSAIDCPFFPLTGVGETDKLGVESRSTDKTARHPFAVKCCETRVAGAGSPLTGGVP